MYIYILVLGLGRPCVVVDYHTICFVCFLTSYTTNMCLQMKVGARLALDSFKE